MPFFHELTVSGAGARRRLSGRHRHRLGLQCRRRLGADPRHPLPRQLQPRGPRAERLGNRLPAGPELRAGLRRSLQPRPAINAGRRPARPIARPTSVRAAGRPAERHPLAAIVSGSNPNLTAETSDSWTVGAVIQPRFIPGFSLSVDYYDITVNDIIVVAHRADDRQQLLRPARPQQRVLRAVRSATAGRAPVRIGEQPGRDPRQLADPGAAQLRQARPRGHRLQPRTTAPTWPTIAAQHQPDLHAQSARSAISRIRPTRTSRTGILGELGDPKDEFRWDVDLTHGPFTFGYRMRYIGPMWTNTYEDFNELQLGPAWRHAPGGDDADWADIRKYPSVTYHDLRFEWNIPSGAGIGRGPALLLRRRQCARPAAAARFDRHRRGSAIYEFRGRNYYAGFRARF